MDVADLSGQVVIRKSSCACRNWWTQALCIRTIIVTNSLFSSSEARSLLANRQRRTPCVLLLDWSYSMEGEKIRHLNAGFDVFRQDILRNPVAAQSVDLAVISFGPVKLERDFAPLSETESLQLQASGATPMRKALELAMLKITERKRSYQQHGISYYRPWIFLLTDGEPTDDNGQGCYGYKALIPPLELAAQEQKFTLFTVGVNVSPYGQHQPPLDEAGAGAAGCLPLPSPARR